MTEFSWDTNPPDPKALAVKLQARWTAEALYVMWKAGITMVTWLDIRDHPYPQNAVQSGLYLPRRDAAAGQAEADALGLFRFPFVAYAAQESDLRLGTDAVGKAGPRRRLPELQGPLEAARRPVRERERDLQRNDQGPPHGLTAGAARRRRQGRGAARSLPFSLKQPPDRLIPIFGSGG